MSLFVLLVEDNLDLSETIIQYLEIDDIVCDYSSNAESAITLTRENIYDVIILDIMLPGMDGIECCKNVRQSGLNTPILMLTARDTLDDKLTGFDAGTDDYLIKPFDLPELVARVKSLAKRKSGQSTKLKVADLEFNLVEGHAKRNNRRIHPTPIGQKILEVLLRESPNIVSRKKLIQSVWGDETPDSNSLKVHLHKLRKQIDQDEEDPLIHTIPHRGYAIRNNKETV